ncbi:cold-shock DEAD-box protein A [Marssonina coronariae]|uniref:Cold-shock DEAD-box protein A n=1 Tax=Diplocarpon coronariae TaxID=2795749 RepID=A0A218ZDL0_9HELO|nr:cold-shock DEAD-box protein A [Marssonina coronariae]
MQLTELDGPCSELDQTLHRSSWDIQVLEDGTDQSSVGVGFGGYYPSDRNDPEEGGIGGRDSAPRPGPARSASAPRREPGESRPGAASRAPVGELPSGWVPARGMSLAGWRRATRARYAQRRHRHIRLAHK